MKKETIDTLKRRGWSPEDIDDTEKIIEERRASDKSRTSLFTSRILYWAVIFLMILGNFIISLLLVPFLLVLNKLAMDVVVVILGFSFGLFFNILILDIEHISKRHHLIAGISIPLLALINIIAMTRLANALNDVLRTSTMRGSPITVSLLYVVAFMMPYLWSVFVKKKIDISYKKQEL